MISDTVITALIVAISSIICQVLINRGNRMKRSKEEGEKSQQAAINAALKEQQLEIRLKNIEAKLDEHNGYAKLFAEVSEQIAEMAKSIAVIETKIGKM